MKSHFLSAVATLLVLLSMINRWNSCYPISTSPSNNHRTLSHGINMEIQRNQSQDKLYIPIV
jgi:hypothetical protein